MGLCQFQNSSLSTFHQMMRIHVKSESFTWLHNHSSWERAVYGGGGHPCPTNTFLVWYITQ